MKTMKLVTSSRVFAIAADGETIFIFIRHRGREKELHIVRVWGQNASENLVLAGREARLSDGDIAFIAYEFQIVLPDDAGITNTYELRGRANRFSPIPL